MFIFKKIFYMKMLKLLMACVFTALTAQLQAQDTSTDDVKVELVGKATSFYTTPPVRSFPKAPDFYGDAGEAEDGKHSSKRQKLIDHMAQAGESPSSIDPLIQTRPATRVAQETSVSFDGITLNVSPPDPSGAVGPNHFVLMTNGRWTVYDKEGNIEPGFPKLISDPLGGGASGNSADPIVLYDREADRWVITKFDLPAVGNSFRIAVSTTGDPTGEYNVYLFQAGSNNDYLKWSIYGNSYMSSGNFTPTGRVYAFDREAIIAGDPDAAFVGFTLPGYVRGTLFQSPLGAHSEGAGVASGKPTIIWYQDDAWPGVAEDGVNLWELDIDWSDPESATVSQPISIPMAAFDANINGNGGDPFANLQQPGTSQRIDALANVLNYQALRYNFGDFESIVINFPVELTNGSRIAGLRWAELRKGTDDGDQWEIYQEGTYVDPVGDESVFIGSIGMDQDGNIAMGYTKTGSDTFPSLYFTGRRASDPLGTMTVAESLIVNGTQSVTNNSRYGDYAQLSRDPEDDLTFWFTSEYSGSSPRRIRIAAFKLSDVLSVDELRASDRDFTISSLDNEVFSGVLNTDSTSDILRLSVFNIQGQRVVYEQVEKVGSTYSFDLDMGSSAAGVYIVTLGNAKTKLSKKIIVR